MNKFLVFQSDFGLVDGAVSAMEGVAYNVCSELKIAHITHDITQYNIFEGSYRLFQTVEYWPEGTVFVSVVDPGVGTSRKSVVVKTSKNQYIVTPNNGTLTHINRFVGIDEIREIEESVNRRSNTEHSYTFHGRDVYAYTGARLASGTIGFEEVGPLMDLGEIVELELFENTVDDNSVVGQIDILDVRFGSLWTSIPFETFNNLGFSYGDRIEVQIFNNKTMVYSNRVTYGKSFADVSLGMPIIYMNSVYHMALAINQGSFAKAYAIGVGSPWTIRFEKPE
ncbi:MAG: S-adenosyl-l-methionine hydroxide adenosyltransferase family protein [Erysipelotrichaceae bacterium]|nr:S-adenosyl-l-methionine hydroxide adenosyltransferase family protein [Erysipelotrichaceae bacterium]